MDQEEKPLEPRFKIQKSRLGAGEETHDAEPEFTPEKVVYAEIDDEITHVFDCLRHLRVKKIALVIPRRAVVLQSIINLKILKKKIDELDKEIVVVTADAPGLQLALKAGFKAVPDLFSKRPSGEQTEKTAHAKSERPMRISEKRVSISDVIRHEKPAFMGALINKIKERLKKKKQDERATRLVFIAPNKQALFTLILVSILLLLTIAYIALPGATVYLTPKASILDPSFNVSFLDYEKNRYVLDNNELNVIAVPTYLVDPPPFTKKFTHPATGKIFRGENARGTITVINLSNAPWDLAARTRFQTNDGLVFRTPAALRIPAARGNAPGSLDVNVAADDFDASGQIIGERGNIPPSKFFLPGLKNEENKKKLYGESRAGMTGGTSQTLKTVSAEDVQAAQEQAKKEISKEASEELKKYLDQQNFVKKTNFSLLADYHAIEISEVKFAIPEDLIGKSAEQFEITAMYSAKGIAFDRDRLITALKERLINRIDPDKKILKISEDDISYKFLDEEKAAGKFRFTVTMRAIQVYELDPEKENGHRFIKKTTDHILGMRVKDALTYLQQQTDEIARVEIKTWPMWAPTIPNIADNIKFEIREEEGLQ